MKDGVGSYVPGVQASSLDLSHEVTKQVPVRDLTRRISSFLITCYVGFASRVILVNTQDTGCTPI